MRTRLESVVTLPTDERAPGVPRCCCSATAGGRPSIESTSGTPTWSIRRRAYGDDRLEVAPLRLGVERAEGERRLARPRDAREDDERVARDVDVDVLQVVLARAADANEPARVAIGCAHTRASPQCAQRRSRLAPLDARLPDQAGTDLDRRRRRPRHPLAARPPAVRRRRRRCRAARHLVGGVAAVRPALAVGRAARGAARRAAGDAPARGSSRSAAASPWRASSATAAAPT